MTSRERVYAAVVAVADHQARCMGGAQPVRAFHVRYFGLPECVTDLKIGTIDGHLRTLADDGKLYRLNPRYPEYLPTAGASSTAG